MFSNAVFNIDSNESKNDVLSLWNHASTKFFAIKKDRKLKNDKYKKFLAFFNVHVDLHFIDMTREYVTVMTVNVLSYKMKHI